MSRSSVRPVQAALNGGTNGASTDRFLPFNSAHRPIFQFLLTILLTEKRISPSLGRRQANGSFCAAKITATSPCHMGNLATYRSQEIMMAITKLISQSIVHQV